jgi:Flp pilus assembly protein TadG
MMKSINNKIINVILSKEWQNNSGGVAIIVGISIIALMSFAALSIDLSHLFVVKNELQNASDAAALAGARVLYDQDGLMINVSSNQTAFDAALLNKSENVPVDVHGLQNGDVQRGHWSFATKTFTPNDSTATFNLWNLSTEELDANVDFINAVRVKTRREDTPAASFLATIFGKDSFTLSAEAVAYIGFAGTLNPGDAEMPITICKESLLIDDAYSCSIGRMINSGQNIQTNNTAAWTSYAQQRESGDPDPCNGGTNANEVREVIDPPGPENCLGSNTDILQLGKPMATMGGEAETVLSKLRNCWIEATDITGPDGTPDGIPDTSWNLTLPVIECPGNNIGVCEEVVGAVNINLVWITGPGESSCDFHQGYTDTDGHWVDANLPPLELDGWSCGLSDPSTATDAELQACWDSFVSHFNLQNADGSTAPCAKKSLYFQPDCTPHEPTGRSGGENFGVLSQIPVLVE